MVLFVMMIWQIILFTISKRSMKLLIERMKILNAKWNNKKVLIVEHFNFEELKLIVKLISFRLIFFDYNFFRFVITLFSVALSLLQPSAKKINGHYPVYSNASL